MSLNSALWQIPAVNLSEDHLVGLQKRLEERLGEISSRFKDVRFATSLAAEDMAVTHGIAKNKKSIRVFTLATGRLHTETVEMTNLVESTYGLSIERVEPDQASMPLNTVSWQAKKSVGKVYQFYCHRLLERVMNQKLICTTNELVFVAMI